MFVPFTLRNECLDIYQTPASFIHLTLNMYRTLFLNSKESYHSRFTLWKRNDSYPWFCPYQSFRRWKSSGFCATQRKDRVNSHFTRRCSGHARHLSSCLTSVATSECLHVTLASMLLQHDVSIFPVHPAVWYRHPRPFSLKVVLNATKDWIFVCVRVGGWVHVYFDLPSVDWQR